MKRKLSLLLLPLLLVSSFITGCDMRGEDTRPTNFVLNEDAITLEVGQTFQLYATFDKTNIKPEYTVINWESAKKAYASVDENGLVTALKEITGTIRITASSPYLDVQRVCKVTVVDKIINPTNISLNFDSLLLEPGTQNKLSVNFEPSTCNVREVTWSSSNPSIVSVSDDGTITAGDGALPNQSAVITVASNVNKSLKASCTVTISEEIIHVTSFNVSPYTATMFVGGTLQMSTEFLPLNAVDYEKEVTWSSSKTSYATIDENGLVTAHKVGTVTITAKSTTLKTTSKCVITIESAPVYPTGVYFERTERSVKPGSIHQLTAIFTPSNCNTEKGLIWSTSNSEVATVTDGGLVTISSSAKPDSSAIITAKSTYNSFFTASCKFVVKDSINGQWTIMIYMCGADLESENNLATMDLTEILSVNGQPDDVNIIIQTGGAKRWNSKYNISSQETGRYHVENKTLVKDMSLSKRNFGLSSTLEDFVEWGLNEYPSDKNGLIFWNHGGGMAGVCYDENYGNDSLSHTEIYTALTNAYVSAGRSKSDKFDFIGYDACLMALQDTEEYLADFASYIVASEESESGYGWDYDTWIDDLYANKPTETILRAIADGFIADNDKYYTNNQTLSIVKTEYFEAYRIAFESFAQALYYKLVSEGVEKSTFIDLITSSVKHYADNDYYYFSTFDMIDFLNIISYSCNPGSSYITNVKNAYADLLLYEKHGKNAGNSNGLCIFFPTSNSSCPYLTSNFTQWKNLCKTYGYV